jgi:hypothetical protein
MVLLLTWSPVWLWRYYGVPGGQAAERIVRASGVASAAVPQFGVLAAAPSNSSPPQASGSTLGSPMSDSETTCVHTDGTGRRFLFEARSPDGGWHVQVFGPSPSHEALYADARHPEYGVWGFPLGREPVPVDRIAVRWDLPNGSWGVFIDGKCWALCAYRPAQRINRRRILTRSGPHSVPFAEEDIRFACAKRRGQRPGTRGFVIEE